MSTIASALVGLQFAILFCGADADRTPVLAVAQGRIERVAAKQIVVVLQSGEKSAVKMMTLDLAATSRLFLATTVERSGKSIVTQHAAEWTDLKARQSISVIYADSGSSKIVLTAIVQSSRSESAAKDAGSTKLPPEIPAKVGTVLKYIDDHDAAPKDFEGGRTFLNLGRDGEESLPRKDAKGKAIRYREWDVNPHVPGKNRGAERLITGSDGSAYYTANHYRTFKKIR